MDNKIIPESTVSNGKPSVKVISTAITDLVPEGAKKVLTEVVSEQKTVEKMYGEGVPFEKWTPDTDVEDALDGVPVERKRLDIPTTKAVLG